jgi:hypothetical protein
MKGVLSSVADTDPGSGAFLTPGSGMDNKSGSGSRINHPDHIAKSLKTIFWVNILKFFDADPRKTFWIRNTGVEHAALHSRKLNALVFIYRESLYSKIYRLRSLGSIVS